jgi:hypothetical protein
MSNIKVTIPEMSIYSSVPLKQKLFDVNRRNMMLFGTVESICNQYGIKMEKDGDRTKFTAPKLRLQYLVEKFHFARVKYSR